MYYMVLEKRFPYGGDNYEGNEKAALDYAVEQAMKRKEYVWVKLCSELKPWGFNRHVATPDGGVQSG